MSRENVLRGFRDTQFLGGVLSFIAIFSLIVGTAYFLEAVMLALGLIFVIIIGVSLCGAYGAFDHGRSVGKSIEEYVEVLPSERVIRISGLYDKANLLWEVLDRKHAFPLDGSGKSGVIYTCANMVDYAESYRRLCEKPL